MRLYPASCKEDSKFPFCTGSKNDIIDPHLHLHGETEARKQFGSFRKSLLLYLLATHLLPLGPPVMQMFFLLFLQDEIRLTEWITRRTSSYRFSHKASVSSMPVMTLTFSEPRPILCHFTTDLYSPWSYRRNEITDRDSFQGSCLCFRRGPRVN